MASRTRERVIEVARQLFTLKGVAHTTMNDIAQASAKGRRTIYMYFKNKKEIYNAILEEESDLLVRSLINIVETDMPIEKKLEKFLAARLDRYLNPANSASLRAWLKFDGRRLEKVRALAREKENAMLEAILEQGVMEGKFQPLRCKLFRGFIYSMLGIEDSLVQTEEEDENRKNAIKCFIEFAVSDIMIKES